MRTARVNFLTGWLDRKKRPSEETGRGSARRRGRPPRVEQAGRRRDGRASGALGSNRPSEASPRQPTPCTPESRSQETESPLDEGNRRGRGDPGSQLQHNPPASRQASQGSPSQSHHPEITESPSEVTAPSRPRSPSSSVGLPGSAGPSGSGGQAGSTTPSDSTGVSYIVGPHGSGGQAGSTSPSGSAGLSGSAGPLDSGGQAGLKSRSGSAGLSRSAGPLREASALGSDTHRTETEEVSNPHAQLFHSMTPASQTHATAPEEGNRSESTVEGRHENPPGHAGTEDGQESSPTVGTRNSASASEILSNDFEPIRIAGGAQSTPERPSDSPNPLPAPNTAGPGPEAFIVQRVANASMPISLRLTSIETREAVVKDTLREIFLKVPSESLVPRKLGLAEKFVGSFFAPETYLGVRKVIWGFAKRRGLHSTGEGANADRNRPNPISGEDSELPTILRDFVRQWYEWDSFNQDMMEPAIAKLKRSGLEMQLYKYWQRMLAIWQRAPPSPDDGTINDGTADSDCAEDKRLLRYLNDQLRKRRDEIGWLDGRSSATTLQLLVEPLIGFSSSSSVIGQRAIVNSSWKKIKIYGHVYSLLCNELGPGALILTIMSRTWSVS